MSVRRGAEPGLHEVTVTYAPVHVAGEGSSIVEVRGEATARFVRDPRRQIVGEVEVGGDIEAAQELSALLGVGVVLPEGGIDVGQRWPLAPIARAVSGEGAGSLSIPRTATLIEVTGGVAQIAVEGSAEPMTVRHQGATVSVEATIEEVYRLRVADAVLVERRSTTEVVFSTPLGRAVDTTEVHVRRVLGAAPAPEAHGYEPGHHPSACAQRLRAMGQRFERTPRGIDFDLWAGLDVEVPVRPSGRPIDEPGPILVGMDEETILGSAAASDVAHTVTVYVVAPLDVSDGDLRRWLDQVIAPGIEIRRVVSGQVHPPSPARGAEVIDLFGRMHEEHSIEPWVDAVRELTAICDPAAEAVAVAEASEPSSRATVLRQGILRAYERCGCDNTDLARLERTLDLRLGGPELGWEPVP